VLDKPKSLFYSVLTVFLCYLVNQTYICRLIILSIQITMSTKTKGTVKFFNGEKGFGFIKHDDSNKETFVHASGLIDQVTEGDLQEGKKGMNAVNVKKA
jgi:cold shock protein